MNYLFQKQLSPLESLGAVANDLGANFGPVIIHPGGAKDSDNGEYASEYSLTLKELSYNNRNPKGEALTVSEFENNFAFIADQAKKNKAAIGELSTTVNNLGSATNAVKMIGKLTGADLNIDTTGVNYINVNTNEVSGYGDTVNFITGETLSIYFPISDVTAQVRLVEVRNGITDSKQSSARQAAAAPQPAFTTSVKGLIWENLENQLVMFPEEDMTNVTITGVDSGIIVPLVNMGSYEPNPIQTITFDESGTYVITDILMTNASASISNAEGVAFLSVDPFSDSYAKGDAEGSLAKSVLSERTSIEDSFIARTKDDENGSSLWMLRSSNSFINTMVGANNGNVFDSTAQQIQLGVSTSTSGGIQLYGNSLVSDEMYLSVMKTEGSAATCDIYVFGYKISDVSTSNHAAKGFYQESSQPETQA
jgi:hypothetical protein